MEAEHSIHIDQQLDEPPFSCYDSSESYDDDTDQDRLNRLSSTSTLIGSPSSSRLHHHSPSSSTSSSSCGSSSSTLSSTSDARMNSNGHIKTTSSRLKRQQQQQQSFGYRFMHSEAGRLACSIFFFVFVCIGMAFCNQLSDHRWIQTGYTEVLLSDRGFDVIAAQSDISPANTFVMTSVVFTVLGVGLICPDWTTRAMALRRVMWIIGTLSVFRAMTLSVTTLPTPKAECRPSLKTGFWDMFIVALQMIPGTVEACTDDIFSGHTVFMVSCAIQWRLYCKNKWITYFSYLYISIGLYFVLATRLHYTVDVVLAVFITYAAWSLYIAMIDVVMEQEYFGIKEHSEKYSAFDQILNEYKMLGEHQLQEQALLQRSESNEESAPLAGNTASTTTSTSAKNPLTTEASWQNHRRRLEHMMNQLRGPRIGYARGEHDRVAFVPMQYNLGLTGLIRWCDGLDLRMRPTEFNTRHSTNGSRHGARHGAARWNDLVVRYRIEKETSGSAPGVHFRHREEYEDDEEEQDEEEKEEEDEYEQDNGLEMAEAGRRGPHKREMTQIYSRRVVDGMTLQGVQICNYEEEVQQQQQQQPMDQQWRSLPLRKATRRSRRSNAKSSTKTGTMDRSKKIRLAKMGLIILLNLLLLVGVVRYVQDKSTNAAVSSSSSTSSSLDAMDSATRTPDSLETFPGNLLSANSPARTQGATPANP